MNNIRHVEVIVPARNEVRHITACLTRVQPCDEPAESRPQRISCGGNLGLRASAYLQAGGLTDTAVHQDRPLVDHVKTVTVRWVATQSNSVTTLGRLGSRVSGGFVSYTDDSTTGDSTCA
jgi:hypothetical protein